MTELTFVRFPPCLAVVHYRLLPWSPDPQEEEASPDNVLSELSSSQDQVHQRAPAVRGVRRVGRQVSPIISAVSQSDWATWQAWSDGVGFICGALQWA